MELAGGEFIERSRSRAVDGFKILVRKLGLVDKQPFARALVEDTICLVPPTSLPNQVLNKNQLVIPALAEERALRETVWH